MLLVEGFIELVGPADPLAGPDGEPVGEIKLRAWRGPEAILESESDAAGVGWVLARKWWP